MKRLAAALLFLWLALGAAAAGAGELRPFTGDSLTAIRQTFAGRPSS